MSINASSNDFARRPTQMERASTTASTAQAKTEATTEATGAAQASSTSAASEEVAAVERAAVDPALSDAARSRALGAEEGLRRALLSRPDAEAGPAVRRGLGPVGPEGWLEANGGKKGLKGKGANVQQAPTTGTA